MASRIRKLTALGLPAREELLVRSLLKVVNGKTTEEWMFHDTLDANLALCRPESALSSMALRRATTHGMLCVSVVHEDEPALPDTLTLRAPIRSTDFIEILNRASEHLVQHARPASAVSPGETQAEPLALALRRRIKAEAASYAEVVAGAQSFVLDVRSGRMASAASLNDEALLRLGLSAEFRWEPLDEERGSRGMASATCHENLERLFWIFGMHAPEFVLADGLPVEGIYALRRWPDAGRLPVESHHLRMASLLVRQPMRVAELSQASGRTLTEARGFLRACAMIGLLEQKPAPALLAAPRRSRYGELFQSIRAVLGIRS